jgi:nitrogenase molybdenum-iron protein alpha/beta subunit
MSRAFGVPVLAAECQAPYGLPFAEAWLRRVGEAIGVPEAQLASALVQEAQEVRRRIVPALAAVDRARPLKGLTAAVFGEGSAGVALAGFLTEYLGLEVVLLGLKAEGPEVAARLKLLESAGQAAMRVLWRPDLTDVRTALSHARPDIVFGSSLEREAAGEVGISTSRCVDFGYPLWHRMVVTPRPFVGYRGTLTLVEDVVNAAAACRG